MSDTPQPHRVDVLGTLVWREWLATGRMISGFAVAWVLGVVVLELCYDPVALIAFGCLYAVVAGTVAGGGEAAAGSEEFSFALPATRHQRYFAPLFLAGSVLLAMQLLGVVAIGLDLPQRLWGLVVESGFTEPFPDFFPAFMYWLALALPLAGFSATFALAANRIGSAWFGGPTLTTAVMGLGFLAEGWVWGHINGVLSIPALMTLALLSLFVGHRFYIRREAVSRPAARPRGFMTLIIVLAAFILLGVFWALFAVRQPVPNARTEAFPPPPQAPHLPEGKP